MSAIEYDGVVWPPAKNTFLFGLDRPHAQAIHKDTNRGCVSGMTYRIEGEKIYLREKPRLIYFVQIDRWEYTIRNDSIETPILSFSYLAGADSALEKAVQNVRVLNRSMKSGYRLPEKTMRVASYLMRQIAQGHVPDAARVLASYKFLPAHPLVPGFFQNSFAYAGGLLKDAT